MEQVQECDRSPCTVLSWVEKWGEATSLSASRPVKETLVLWNKFDSLKVVTDRLCQSFEYSHTGQRHLKQSVSTTLRPKILESIHCSETAAHLGLQKLQKSLEIDSIGQDMKKMSVCLPQVVLFVITILAPSKTLDTALSIGLLVSLLPTLVMTSVEMVISVSNGNSYVALLGDYSTKLYEAVPLPDQTPEMTATALLEHRRNWPKSW